MSASFLSRVKPAIEALSTVVMIGLAAVLVWQGARHTASPAQGSARAPVPVPQAPIRISPEQTIGGPAARVALVVYSDFECPYCSRFAKDTMPAVIRDYVDAGTVRVSFKNFPLPSHSSARAAAAAAVCAGIQGRFWQMHDRLFALSPALGADPLRLAAREVVPDLPKYDSCVQTGKAMERIDADAAEGKALEISGTPTSVIGSIDADGAVRATAVLVGAKGIGELRSTLDGLLAKSDLARQPPG